MSVGLLPLLNLPSMSIKMTLFRSARYADVSMCSLIHCQTKYSKHCMSEGFAPGEFQTQRNLVDGVWCGGHTAGMFALGLFNPREIACESGRILRLLPSRT